MPAHPGSVGGDHVEELEVREPQGVPGPAPLGDDVGDSQAGHDGEEPETGGSGEDHRAPPARRGVAR
jgi:hypothetical protein